MPSYRGICLHSYYNNKNVYRIEHAAKCILAEWYFANLSGGRDGEGSDGGNTSVHDRFPVAIQDQTFSNNLHVCTVK